MNTCERGIMNKNKIIETFHEGHCIEAYRLFGAHIGKENNQSGVRFTVYAPHARRVYVIGNFTEWDEHPVEMQRTDAFGIWSVFINHVFEWDCYKYKIETGKGDILYKADPYAFYSETRPNNASKIYDFNDIQWTDEKWMQSRNKNFDQPVNIYEVYAGGWKKHGEYPYTYLDLEKELIPYVKEKGFTHIEMMPLCEYPFDGSWGYQASGYYSLTSRYGNGTEFASFVNACHREGIGLIIDMVPVHFVKDAFGLIAFDGEPLYEYADVENRESQWGTMNFNLWNEEVRSFLMSSACFWCDVYHIDGIRVDAVSNLIYWGGNSNRGVNQGSVDFVKRMNYYLNREYPGVMLIAEDSSDFAKVTASTLDGGLGFDYKWDLGWMNDTLKYYSTDPLYRVYDHHLLTFSMHYFYSEKFILPFSHDENVHGKKTIIDRMWGDYETKFSQARNLYAYMYAHPGKKLNFIGNEIASFREFDEKKEIDWFLLEYPKHRAFAKFFSDLNHIYLKYPALYQYDYTCGKGFQWIDADNAKQSVFTFVREDDSQYIVCIMNCKPESYPQYDVKVPQNGVYKEILNTEDALYGGCNMCNKKPLHSITDGKQGVFSSHITIQLAPWATIYFVCDKKGDKKKHV